jgi:hypothetical protein
MCRIIFEAEGLVRRAPLECSMNTSAVEKAVTLVEYMSHWRFVAVERCVFSDHHPTDDAVARLRAL